MLAFLDSYRWSSFLDYCGKKNFPSLLELSSVQEILEFGESYRDDITEWLRDGADEHVLTDIILD